MGAGVGDCAAQALCYQAWIFSHSAQSSDDPSSGISGFCGALCYVPFMLTASKLAGRCR